MKVLDVPHMVKPKILERLLTDSLEGLSFELAGAQILFPRDISTEEWEITKLCFRLAGR